jgi:hypothetical protein
MFGKYTAIIDIIPDNARIIAPYGWMSATAIATPMIHSKMHRYQVIFFGGVKAIDITFWI